MYVPIFTLLIHIFRLLFQLYNQLCDGYVYMVQFGREVPEEELLCEDLSTFFYTPDS